MLKALYVTRPLTHGFLLLHEQCCPAVKRKNLRYGWISQKLAQQRSFASKKDDEWYDWYARLGVDPKASPKDLRRAFYKKAKVEHPDHDQSTGAKERFQNLQDTFEWLCDESKRKEHDRQRLARQKAAADMMATQPSVADSLRTKWKAEEEALRKAQDLRTREARKTARGNHQSDNPSKTNGTKADSHSPKGAKTENPQETPRKEQQRQRKPEETEEERLRKQKIADDLLAKKKAAAAEKKRRDDAAAEQTRQTNRLQERVIVIRDLPAGTKLVDILEPLVDLVPGPVFDSKLWSARIAMIEFCTDSAARAVLALAQKGRLHIKGSRMANVQLIQSKNKIPVIGSVSRVLIIKGKSIIDMLQDIDDFLVRNGLQVERIVCRVDGRDPCVRLASWADAEKASRLLAKFLPDREISYGPDPCGAEKDFLTVNAKELLRSLGFAGTERERENLEDTGYIGSLVFWLCVLSYLAYKLVKKWWETAPTDTEDESELPTTTCITSNMGSDGVKWSGVMGKGGETSKDTES